LNCDTSKAKITTVDLTSVPIEEQESHFNVSRMDQKIYVCCSNQMWITKLIKNPLFKVTHILKPLNSVHVPVSDLKILEIKGILPLFALSLRSKKRSNPSKKGINPFKKEVTK